jgi:hypothetical protein
MIINSFYYPLCCKKMKPITVLNKICFIKNIFRFGGNKRVLIESTAKIIAPEISAATTKQMNTTGSKPTTNLNNMGYHDDEDYGKDKHQTFDDDNNETNT